MAKYDFIVFQSILDLDDRWAFAFVETNFWSDFSTVIEVGYIKKVMFERVDGIFRGRKSLTT